MQEKVSSLLQKATLFVNGNSSILKNTNKLEEDLTLILTHCYESACKDTRYNVNDIILIDSTIDRIWERLNTGHWQDVPQHLRDLYGYASFLKVVMLLKRALCQREDGLLKNLHETIKAADMGLLLGSSLREELSEVATSLCDLIHLVSAEKHDEKINLFFHAKTNQYKASLGDLVPVLFRPSIESFLTNNFTPRVPVKLKGCIEHWPALEKWQKVEYIMKKIGPRTVPVEIGSSYASINWSQKLMTVRSFVENFMLNENQEIGYLAQHQLFNQIPELLEDICEPEYCVLSDNFEHIQSGTDMNAWFGPAHTVSPLHYDPKHNLLTQIVGTKQIILIDPKWSENVYPYDDRLLHNTARVKVEEPDFETFPKFKDVKCLQCILEPGDMLYIPPKWWHHVRSLSASFSVSFWWT